MENINFSKRELERYSRHLILPEFNIKGQRKLKSSKVLVVGTGGLGSPVLLYLAAAGIGTIGLLDYDTVDESNLQRQVLFSEADVGKPKVDAAVERLKGLNPFVQYNTHYVQLRSENALDIFKDYDVIVDGTDNFPTRYLVNDACVILGKPNVYGSIFRFEGQVSVFNYTDSEGNTGPNYRDLFPAPPPPGLVPGCAEGGVLGVLPGIIGSLQANEVIKVVSGIGETLSGRLFLLDALTFETRTLILHKNPKTPVIKNLIDYEQFCGLGDEPGIPEVKEIQAKELKRWMDTQKTDFQLIDVREDFEREISTIGGEWIPGDSIDSALERIPADKKVIFYCRSGIRSADIIDLLQAKYGFDNLYNLKGGINAWAEEIDPDMPVY